MSSIESQPASPSRPGCGTESPATGNVAAAIRERAALLGELRRFFDSRGFLETQPPCLLPDCVVDAYLDPIAIDPAELRLAGWGRSVDGGLPTPARRLYLQTSPELAMKKMLVAGAPSIYSIGPVFRGGESGPLHRIEFTMLEWYEVEGDQRSAIELLGTLASTMLQGDRFEVRSYRELFVERLGLDPIDVGLEELRREVGEIDPTLAVSLGKDRDGMLDLLLSQRVQPDLGRGCPLILKDYPLSQSALAKASQDDPSCAARFELFVNGIELANGYDELLDPDELLERARLNNAIRVAAGRSPLPLETSLVTAMRAGLPSCAGVALGVDRLQMVKHGHADLRGCGFDGLSQSW